MFSTCGAIVWIRIIKKGYVVFFIQQNRPQKSVYLDINYSKSSKIFIFQYFQIILVYTVATVAQIKMLFYFLNSDHSVGRNRGDQWRSFFFINDFPVLYHGKFSYFHLKKICTCTLIVNKYKVTKIKVVSFYRSSKKIPK